MATTGWITNRAERVQTRYPYPILVPGALANQDCDPHDASATLRRAVVVMMSPTLSRTIQGVAGPGADRILRDSGEGGSTIVIQSPARDESLAGVSYEGRRHEILNR
jgi:hypothetical protein